MDVFFLSANCFGIFCTNKAYVWFPRWWFLFYIRLNMFSPNNIKLVFLVLMSSVSLQSLQSGSMVADSVVRSNLWYCCLWVVLLQKLFAAVGAVFSRETFNHKDKWRTSPEHTLAQCWDECAPVSLIECLWRTALLLLVMWPPPDDAHEEAALDTNPKRSHDECTLLCDDWFECVEGCICMDFQAKFPSFFPADGNLNLGLENLGVEG